jgi:hypothetical protein
VTKQVLDELGMYAATFEQDGRSMKPSCLALGEEAGTVVVTVGDKLLGPLETRPTPPRSIPSPTPEPHPEHEVATAHVLQPYCNRADTHWYTMDKVIPPDHRKPPKRAQFPDV